MFSKDSIPKIVFCSLCCLGALWVYLFGTNVLIVDEWTSSLNMTLGYFEGQLSLPYFFEQHNEHRIPIPKLFFLIIGVLFKHNSLFFMYFSQLLMLISVFFLYKLVRIQIPKMGDNPFVFMCLPLLFLNLRHYQNFLLGFQICFTLVFFFSVLSFYFLNEWQKTSQNKHLILASVFAIFASFTSLQGLFVWVIGAVYLVIIFIMEKKIRLGIVFAWGLCVGLLLVYYFLGLKSVEHHPSLEYIFNNLIHSVLFFFVVIGDFSPNLYLAMLLGFVFVGYFVLNCILVFKNNLIKQNLIWIVLGLYVLLFALSVTVSRAGFGEIKRALASRYCIFTFLLILANIMLGFALSKRTYIYNLSHKIYLFFVISFSLIVMVESIRTTRIWHKEVELYSYKLKNHIALSDIELQKNVFYPRSFFEMQNRKMQKWKLNVYAE